MAAPPSDRDANRHEMVDTTVVKIQVPSGTIIAADSLSTLEYFDVEPWMPIDSEDGIEALTHLHATRLNTAYAFVGNSSPTVTRQADGALNVIRSDVDDAAMPVLNEGESAVAEICTEMWSVMFTDYQNWLDHGGEDISVVNRRYACNMFTLIEVTPGTYRWTVYSHADSFDMDAEGRVTYARLELIQAM